MLDNSSNEELDVVIETDEESIMLPSLSELVKAVDNTQLLPAIRCSWGRLGLALRSSGITLPGCAPCWHCRRR